MNLLLRTRYSSTRFRIVVACLLVAMSIGLFGHISRASGGTIAGSNSIYDAAANAACQPLKVYGQPAAGFDPLTATDQQLSDNGFPPRPPESDSGALATWTAAVSAAKTAGVPQPICGTTLHYQFSGNWAGHYVPNSVHGSTHFTWSESNWIQPEVPGDSSYSNYQDAPDASFWTGLGVNDLIQAGADSISTSTPQYHFWTEDYPEGTVWEGPVIRPDDQAYVYVSYLGDYESSYFLENVTTGNYQSFDNPSPDVGYAAANFINERIAGYYLPEFTEAEVTGNYYGDNSDTWSLDISNDTVVMTSDCTSSGTTLSEPTGVSDTDFSQDWYNSSPYSDSC